MKITLIVLIILAVATVSFMSFRNPIVDFTEDTKGGIEFHKGTFSEALQRAKREHKLVFLDIYAVWCGPCKKLKSKTFANNEVGDFFNNSFVNVALDGEEEEGNKLAERYGVRGYPTLLFINEDGDVVMSASGYHNVGNLIELGTNAKNRNK